MKLQAKNVKVSRKLYPAYLSFEDFNGECQEFCVSEKNISGRMNKAAILLSNSRGVRQNSRLDD